MSRQRLIFSGSGGQGLITAAIILAEAAVIHEGLNATQSQSYGAAARGGVTRSDIIISDAQIDFPKVVNPDILVCLTQEAYNATYHIIRPGGLLLSDPHYVDTKAKADARQVRLALYENIMEKIGRPIVLNICMLGALQHLTGLVRRESLLKILQTRVPGRFFDMNKTALELGAELAASAEKYTDPT
ncbi:MAG: 2-oxoacid:acceptor oxidoreductase family protein [Desulfohalobiaceae bacterium]|nr:2-oxoacid:acceptor oxidoreductase family protein [Desulfohalobiaceae bacterium]